MKILQINAVYDKGSTGRTTAEMHDYFLKHGFDSYVASPQFVSSNNRFIKIGNLFDRKIHALLSRLFGLQGYFSLHSTKKLIQKINEIDPDVVILRNLHANYLNFRALLSYLSDKHKIVFFVLHDSWFYTGKCVYYVKHNCNKWQECCGNCPAKRNGNISYFLDMSRKVLADKKRLYAKLDKFVAVGVSQWVENDLHFSILKNATLITHIYNWIPFEIFNNMAKSDFRKRYNLVDKFVVLCVASFWDEDKGFDLVLELLEILPNDMVIVMVGQCKKEISKDNIIFLGSISKVGELAGLYAGSDVFLNPTIQETFGKTTAEAMSCGTPVVAFRTTANPELIGDDGFCGEYIKERTSKSILDALMIVKSRTKTYYSTNCVIRSKLLFDKESNIKSYIDIFNIL